MENLTEGEAKPTSNSAGIEEKTVGNAVMVPSTGMVDSASKSDADRNGVFFNLVREDGDIVGLVAYSIYKQNKVDWLHAFEKAIGRGPTDAELTAYIIGEATPRRLSIYRHLAAATLAGNGPDAAQDSTSQARSSQDSAWLAHVPARQVEQRKTSQSWIVSSILSYAILAAAILIGVWLVARYGVAARP